ncbi:MAG: M15 family metallopeptidase, partial [Patescibacteria group bacterium]|nr:M15 family metallopeptidase [Patescibacteria group bacterium]
MRKALAFIAGTVAAVTTTAAAMYATSTTTAPATHVIKPVAVVKPKPAAPAFNKSLYSTTDPASLWVVVNKQHPLPSTYVPANTLTIDGQQVQSDAGVAFARMAADAKAAGFPLSIISGYRSYATQVQVYNQEVKTNGQAGADNESARPGYSEHQTGLAIDIGTGTDNLQQAFGATPAGQWLAANSYKY